MAALAAVTALCAAAGELELRPLFNSCGVYFKTECGRGCTVTYREKGTDKWLPAFEATYDRNYESRYRTSIVDLKPDTVYEVKAEAVSGRQKDKATGTFRTWAENVPIAKKIVLTQQQVKKGFVIKDKGTPQGWILYTAAPGTVINGSGKYALELNNAEYVIVENMTIRGGKSGGVALNNCKYVRLRNLDISGWGDPENWRFDRGSGRMVNAAGHTLHNKNAIYINRGFGQVIERCYIHDPLLSSNCWRYGHPDGPQGISPWKPESTVIRYNDICASDLKWWNDGISGTGNFLLDGGLNKDCDVYGNFIAFANDDCIELDGGQQNVRCFRNRFENSFMGISIQGCMTGPSYIFENCITDLMDELGSRSNAIKTADIWVGLCAASFIFNNTCDQIGGRLRFARNFKIVAKNNILEEIVIPPGMFPKMGMRWKNNLVAKNGDKKSLKGKALFTDPDRGIYTLKAGSPGYGKAIPIPGLNYKNPDLGVPRNLELPYRPFALSLSNGRKALFTVKKGKASAPQKITVKASGPVEFEVRKSLDSDWYDVTPSKVSLKANETVTLTVSVKPEKMATRINYRSVFFLRTAQGWSRPVTVMAKTDFKYPDEAPGRYIYKPGAPFKKVSGGGVRFDDKEKKFEFQFDLEKPGTVFIGVEARALEPVGRHDSITLGMNGKITEYLPLRGISSKAYSNIPVASFKLPAGKHTVTVIPRESIDLRNVSVITDVRALERR